MADKLPMLWILQGEYPGGHGWEDLDASEVRSEVVTNLANYQRSGLGVYRIIRRRQREGE